MRICRRWQETIERQAVESVSCDWCGEPVEIVRGYDERSFVLSYEKGHSYGGDGGHKIGWDVEDLCDECVGKLRILLESNGVRVTPVDVDW